MHWIRISQILCVFGFLKEFRPNEPFIFEYLTHPPKNFTSTQVTEEIYPIGTYSNFATLIIVFLLTDFLRYKPVIILCGLSGIITFIGLILGDSIPALIFVEIFYGFYISAEVAYYTYIYAKVDKEHYQAVSSYTRSALLLGRFITGVIAQIIIIYGWLDYHQLNYLTVIGQVLATIWSLFLPSVGQSVYFHRKEPIVDSDVGSSQRINDDNAYKKLSFYSKVKRAYYLLWKDFVKAFTNLYIVKWSLWWTLASCGYLQVLVYAQSIWQTSIKENETIYNGAVEALYTIIGGLTVYGVGKLKLNWALFGDIILSIFSFIMAVLLFVTSWSYNIMLQYAVYIAFGVIYHSLVTVASFEVASKISEDSFGLIFGINVFLGLTFQSLLTYIVTSGNVKKFHIRTQFTIYAGYFAVLALIFALISVFTIIKAYKKKEKSQHC
ncbi:Similar to Slc19a2: Thiamine transporter 1 (Mus musculus) [Cotesia congregata]|uniref:Similar to Slc19a2: Thiamine transporter 1 (Mus musculus) n=1 Tax=Cotesia congregata TaxID=51543 RepID=A0A8J2HI63_COTCN|nr:Similar to Slc19a2: Thiamine transporter 1 (Mus musculus) [Cotesia congregata]